MKKYRVYGLVYGSKYLGTIEAENQVDAERRAWNELDVHVSICHQCSKEIDDPQIDELQFEEEQ